MSNISIFPAANEPSADDLLTQETLTLKQIINIARDADPKDWDLPPLWKTGANDLVAFVEGRSSLGRKGLSVATATHIAPGFHGVVVLELTNLGMVPLQLCPGMPVAQLVFVLLNSPTDRPYRGRSYCQVRP